ncbi:MAG: hypothetical protein JW896_06010 [Deltaproteobacteria bacterium]|nr:hypothetical protein [Deltaproteobacteria bacterium]
MKKTIYTIFCFTMIFYIFPIITFASDFSDIAISAFQEYRKSSDALRTAFLSGDTASLKEKGELVETHKENFTKILRSLPGEYCADHQPDLLREFIKTLTGITDEYPTYVFAELYACDPDTVLKEIQSLTPEDQKKIVDDLDYGFKNITYKIESLPNYKELIKKLNKHKKMIRKKD